MVHYYKGELPKKNTFEGRTFLPFLGKVYKIYLKHLGKMYVIAYFCLGKMYFWRFVESKPQIVIPDLTGLV